MNDVVDTKEFQQKYQRPTFPAIAMELETLLIHRGFFFPVFASDCPKRPKPRRLSDVLERIAHRFTEQCAMLPRVTIAKTISRSYLRTSGHLNG